MSFGLKTTLFTAIKVDKFHYILAEIKMQAMPGRFSEHRLRIALFSQQQINSLLRISAARLRVLFIAPTHAIWTVVHSDNGAPMKAKNILYQCYDLGVQTHYSRPRQSNDNAYIESSFALLKHCHTMPIPKSFKTLEEAHSWCEKFYTWYNEKHLHCQCQTENVEIRQSENVELRL